MVLEWIGNYFDARYHEWFQPWVNEHWHYIEPYYEISRSVLFHSVVAFVIASFCLYISAFLFGALYYYNMPTAAHSLDLNFHYNRECIERHRNYLRNGIGGSSIYSRDCYPQAIVDFDSADRKKVIRTDQAYRVYLTLELPESDTNLGIGMFMVTMKSGQIISTQPASIKFRPSLIRLASVLAFWPFMLFDIVEAKQTLNIPLVENARFEYPSKAETEACQKKLSHSGKKGPDCNHRIAHIEIDYPDIQIYSAHLQVTATFTGLQYFLFQWPVFSFLVGTGIFFVPVLASVLVVFYLILFKPYRAIRQALSICDEGEQRRGRARRLHNRQTTPTEVATEVTQREVEMDGEDGSNVVGDSNTSSTVSSSSVEMLGSPLLENIHREEALGIGNADNMPQIDDAVKAESSTGEVDMDESETIRKRK